MTTAATRGRRALFVRQGLVALAAGVLAGVSTKLTEQTAHAANGDNLIIGNTAGTGAQTSTAPTTLNGTVASGEGALRVSNASNRAIYASTTSGANAIFATSTGGAAIFATSTSNAGIWGQATSSFGLLGTSTNSTGLYGASSAASPGLYGVATAGPGVRGDGGLEPSTASPNGNTQPGVLGVGIGGPGVAGSSTSGIGVQGQSTNNTGVQGTATGAGTGVYGTSSGGAGVWGNSGSSIGVYGVGGTGVLGQSTNGNGVTAISTNGVAFRANGPSELYGNVEIGDFESAGTPFNLNVTGELRVNGQKNAIVRGADGEFRSFYCLEAAESYFEDFGTVKLSGGLVRVAIPEDFREFVAPERGFYIQLTPLGPSNPLYVSTKDVTGFEIREAGGGTSDIEVQYRIVARRRDVPGERLKRVNPSAEKPRSRDIQLPTQNPEEGGRRRLDIAPPPPPPQPTSDGSTPSPQRPERGR